MKEPVLVIMAAGMGSRYGGLKQIDPVDEQGHMIIDFSIYDAIRAGFKKILFIIKKEIEETFKESIGERLSKHIEVEYVYQDINNLPVGFRVPEGRKKPWGTGHAVLSCLGKIDGPFAVINADDYYGKHAFSLIYNYLIRAKDEEKYQYAMVGYILSNTLTDYGYVARGVCQINSDSSLIGIRERTHIEKKNGKAYYTEDDGKTFNEISMDSTVSMNMWGFTPSILEELNIRFRLFLQENIKSNPLKAEYFLPNVVGDLINESKAGVQVLKTPDKWYGVTYKEDKEEVVKAIARLKEEGIYPTHLW
ncbi:nucleotidyltransferase-like protein [Mobilisporobacter senegalensis]|uniref:Nucleotidyltransferase-like protein n=1 Tax=Mobilisporobacter senegalensis TaxID=1329262 RepID=A0A3N1XKE6_9FIRM|nr:sugar phosphate nucleotidyltransferase [Mobilisporobacter senegalensis]ROR27194.1 nucleotidyltransferase-like protein [Mobilisporobacter senegalensis]